MLKLPYGISNFKTIQVENAFYVDRTMYIEKLEQLFDKTVIFLRPRRFGKSLFANMLDYYYNIQYKDKFAEIFGDLYIGQHPTALANSYWVLNLHFAGINTSDPEDAVRGFLFEVKGKVSAFATNYLPETSVEELQNLANCTLPSEAVSWLINQIITHPKPRKIYIVIDEYDHFANELLAFSYEEYRNAVSKNGFVRKFYEQLKEGTKLEIIDRVFMTGVSAITLDSMTSGFNIGTNYSTDENLHNMLGFTEAEVVGALRYAQVPTEKLPEITTNLRTWYNGYRFNEYVTEQLYNPSMVLYFTRYYGRYQRYPREIMDVNIASDYSKVRKMFVIGEQEDQNIKYLQEILETGTIEARLNHSFSLETEWTKRDLVSLLFYNGILTIAGSTLDNLLFKIPNLVIRTLYFQYFNSLVLQRANFTSNQADVSAKVQKLAQENNFEPLLQLVRDIIAQLGREDFAHFNETTLKSIFASLFYVVGYYNIFSELEVRKSDNAKGRIDLLLTRRPPYQPNHQFVFELKYLRQKDKGQKKKVKTAAVAQLKDYLENDDYLRGLSDLRAYVLLLVGNSVEVITVQ